MNTARVGNAKEVQTARLLQEDGWVVGSRRHIGGAGDLLAIRVGSRPRLIEVKCRKNLWEGFRAADRMALLTLAESADADALVAWWKPGASEPEWLAPHQWPLARSFPP